VLVDLGANRTTSRELLEEAVAVMEATASLGTVVAADLGRARREADALDGERASGRLRGPLHGAIVTVKDVIDVAGLPTRGGSDAYDDLPTQDAGAVVRLREAGALVFAKVATHEFALGVVTPQCRNPHNPDYISGGSSGGSAIAVQTGVGQASLGTDTRASLRVPAALCGVVGFKPTYGRIATNGIIPLSWSTDHVGPITRTVEDAAIVLDAIAEAHFLDLGSDRPVGTLGYTPGVFADASSEVALAGEAAIGELAKVGWKVLELDSPSVNDLEVANAIGLLITRAEAATYHRGRATDLDRCIPEVREQLLSALDVSAADYLDAQRQRHVFGRRLREGFAVCDVIATPTTPITAPRHDEYERHLLRLARNTMMWSLLGAPAVSVPVGVDHNGLPIGIQLAAAPGDEQSILDAGRALEGALAE
jgi:aspartyl-tRNA(Asn)/glutamyl-tRNA(Gln) amidotransferase subunit A